MKAHLITALCLVLAITFYTLDFEVGGALLLAAGVVAECVFWYRLFFRRRLAGNLDEGVAR